MSFQSLKELNTEFATRATDLGLEVAAFGGGDFFSNVAIVSDYLGATEERTGINFSGGSGNLLWSALQRIHLRRNNVYATNVIKRVVASGSVRGREALPVHEEQYWQHMLLWELSQLPNLKYVLVLGTRALHAVTGERLISHWRGSVLERVIHGRTVKCVLANNPAAVLRSGQDEVVFRFDIAKLGRVIEGRYKEHTITHHINPTVAEGIEWCDHIQAEAEKGAPVSFDIEVIANETACVGLAASAHEGMCINFRDFDSNRYSTKDEIKLRMRIARLLRHDAVKLVAQNGNFDSYWLGYKDHILVPRIWFDTLLAHHTLYSLLPHNLGFLTSQYTDHPFYKDEKDKWKEGGDIDQFWRYNVKDCCITHAVHTKLHNELRAQNMDKFFFDHVMQVQPHLPPVTIIGILCDQKLKREIQTTLEEDLEQKREQFFSLVQSLTGEPDYRPNPASPTQLKELFFSKLRLIGRGVSTGADNRTAIKRHPNTSEAARRMLNLLDDISTDQKFLGTYAKMRTDGDSRIRTEYKQFGTQSAPGRLSSAAPLWGTGTNLQNQPTKAQPMFLADKGYCFVYFDLSQAEARFVGWDAEIQSWIEDFERARLDSSFDCHRALASELFDVPYDDVPKSDQNPDGTPTIRYIAKRCRHGLNYRMQADRLSVTTGLPLFESKGHFDTYHRKTPELRKWWTRLEQEFKKNRMLFNAYGRRLVNIGRMDDEALKSIVAFRPQSTIGDHILRVWRKSQTDDSWPKQHARIMLNNHDALIAMVLIERAMDALRIMVKHAEEPIIVRPNLPPMIIPAEAKISIPDERGIHRWSSLAPVDVR